MLRISFETGLYFKMNYPEINDFVDGDEGAK